jgi:hypothetical protein
MSTFLSLRIKTRQPVKAPEFAADLAKGKRAAFSWGFFASPITAFLRR